MRSIRFGNAILSFSDTSGSGSVNGRKYQWDFDSYLGPLFLKKNGDPLEIQPREHHPVWPVFYRWLKKYNAKGCKEEKS